MLWIQITLIALAVSLDSLVVGVSYGFRRVSISGAMMAVVASLSAALKVIAMLLGRSLVLWLSPAAAPRIGATILAALGVWFLLGAFFYSRRERVRRRYESGPGNDEDRALLAFRLRQLGVAVWVLDDPEAADMDDSRSISTGEAGLLGLALGFDAMGAGISAGLMQLPVVFTAVAVGLGTIMLLSVGTVLGARLQREMPASLGRALPGTILLALGCLTWLTA